jgi:subtilase family protein
MDRQAPGALARLAFATLILWGAAAHPGRAEEVPAPAPPRPRYETLHDALRAGAVDLSVIKELERTGRVEAIVTLLSEPVREQLSEEEFEALREADRATLEKVLREFNPEELNLRHRYEALPLAHVRLYSLETLLRLLRHGRVLGVSEDGLNVRLSAAHLPLIGKAGPAAWPGGGAGVSVAVIDSGIDYGVSGMGGCVLPGPGCPVAVAGDFAPDDGMRDDALLHGTQVASVIRAVAPAARLLSLDVFDPDGARDSVILAAIDFALLNRATYNVRALNLSLGKIWPEFVTPCGGVTLFQRNPYAIAFTTRVRPLGVLPIVAAGNNGDFGGRFVDGVTEPACAPGAVAVGAIYDALDDFDMSPMPGCTDATAVPFQPICFSSTGPLLALWAPGVNIPVWAGPNNGTNVGTSFAAPHVAGAVAVLASLQPSASAAEIDAALRAPGGVQVTDTRNMVTRPALHIPNAVQALQPFANDAFSGARTLLGTSGSWAQNTIGATTGTGEAAAAAPASLRATTWFNWQAPLPGTVTFSTAGSDFDARVRVFTGTALATLTEVPTNRGFLSDGTETALFIAAAGTTYRVVVGGQPLPQLDSGRLSLGWQLQGAFGDRDMFAQAAALSGGMGMLAGTNVAATREPGEPDHCGNDGGASVWFAWTAPTTGRFRFTMVPGSLVMGCVSVYQGSAVSGLTRIAGDPWNDPPPANARVAVFDAIGGTTFRIVVDGLMCEDGPPVCTQPAKGSFTLTWAPTP